MNEAITNGDGVLVRVTAKGMRTAKRWAKLDPRKRVRAMRNYLRRARRKLRLAARKAARQ